MVTIITALLISFQIMISPGLVPQVNETDSHFVSDEYTCTNVIAGDTDGM